MNTELVTFSPETLNAMKKDLMDYLGDLVKEVSDPNVRIMINGVLADLDTIDATLIELGAS